MEILDYGKRMDKESLTTQVFSTGKSFKGKEGIGVLGIGMYTRSGIWDTLVVALKWWNKE